MNGVRSRLLSLTQITLSRSTRVGSPSGDAALPSAHVLLIADEELVPPHDGGRLATLNDESALRAAGYDVSTLVVHRQPLSADDIAAHESALNRAVFAPQLSPVRASFMHPQMPLVVSSRMPRRRDVAAALDSLGFLPPPGVVIAAHEYTLPLAISIARGVGGRVILRSHNDEVAYLRSMLQGARVRRAVHLELDAFRLRRTLGAMLREVSCVALISADDAPIYDRHEARTLVVPPTLAVGSRSVRAIATFGERKPQLLFVGAMDSPHNAKGALWLSREVLPRVRSDHPSAELMLIGREMSPVLRSSVASLAGVRVGGHVESLDPYFDGARVFANPMFGGSGVSMKLGPPAAAGLPIVSTTFGLRGVQGLAGPIVRADTADEFAAACSRLLTDGAEWTRQSQALSEAVRLYGQQTGAHAWNALLAAVV